MEIFEPLIICGSVSLIFFAIGFLTFVIERVYEIDRLRNENDRLRKENESLSCSLELLKKFKGVSL